MEDNRGESKMVSFNSKDVFNLPKFDGSNFPIWKFHIFMVLKHHKLMGLINGNEPKSAGKLTVTDEEVGIWEQRDNAAQLYITSPIEPQQSRKLINCKTAQEIWERLTCQFEMASAENKHILLRKFFEYRYPNNLDVMSHITAIETIANQLKDVGSPIDDQQLITKIICTLPPSFQHFVAAWDNVPDDRKTVSLLTSRLLRAENTNQPYGETTNKEPSGVVKGQNVPIVEKLVIWNRTVGGRKRIGENLRMNTLGFKR